MPAKCFRDRPSVARIDSLQTDSTQVANCAVSASLVAVAPHIEAGTQAETDSAVGSDPSVFPLASSSPRPHPTSDEMGPGLGTGSEPSL